MNDLPKKITKKFAPPERTRGERSRTSRWVKIGAAATRLGVSIDTLRRWEKAGKIGVIRTPGGTRLYSISTLKELTATPTRYKRLESSVVSSQSSDSSIQLPTTVEDLIKHLDNETSNNKITPETDQKWQEFVDERKFEPEEAVVFSEAELPESVISHQSSVVSKPFFSHKIYAVTAFSSVIATFILAFLLFARLSNFNDPISKLAQIFNFHQSENDLQLSTINHKPSTTKSGVLAATTAGYYLDINSDVAIEGNLAVAKTINGLTLTPNTDGFSIAGGDTARKLTVLNGDVTLDQDVSTKGSPSFVALKLPATSNQISMGGAGILTWTPTGAKIITLPNATGTVLLDSATQTITNKSLSGSSNTFTSIPNSALSNNKITITAGTNLSGGGDISLGSSGTLSLLGDISLATVTATSYLTLSQTTAPAITTDKLYNVLGALLWNGVDLSSGGALPAGTLTGQTLYWNSTAWNTSSNLFNNGTNVGIGTTNPGAALEVAGQIKITGGSPGTNKVLTSDITGLATWTSVSGVGGITGLGTAGYIPVFDSTSSIVNSSTIWNSGGNVGIGTTSPDSKLSILSADNTQATNILDVYANNNTQGIGIGYDSIRKIATVADSAISLLAKGVGNIWLGSNTPGTGLRIRSSDLVNTIYNGANNIGITADTGHKIFLSQTSSSATGLTVDTTSGNVGIGTTNPAMKLDVEGGGALLGSSIYVSPTNINTLNGGYGSNIGNYDFWLNYRGYKDGLTQDRNLKIGDGKGNALVSVIGSTGNVGIGTTNPLQKLEVNGAGYFSSGAYIGANNTNNLISTASTGAGSTQLYIGNLPIVTTTGTGGSISGSTNQVGYFTGTNTLGGSNNFWFNGTNVGIGTTGPSYPLQINKTNSTIGLANSALTIENPTGNQSIQSFTFGGVEKASIRADSANLILNPGGGQLYFGQDSVMTGVNFSNSGTLYNFISTAANGNSYFNTGGNVGIGGTAPTAKLSIFDATGTNSLNLGHDGTNGTITSTSGKVAIGAGGGTLYLNTDIQNTGSNYGGLVQITDSAAITGSLGIGTTSLSATLDLVGTFQYTDGNQALNKVLTSDASGNATWTTVAGVGGVTGTGTSNYIPVFTSTSAIGNSSIWNSGGNVGIGTTSPASALQVVGNIAGTTFNGNTLTTGTGTLTLNNNTLSLGGNLTTANAFTTSGAYGITLTATNTTNSTLPAGTDTLAGLGTTQTFTGVNTFNGNLIFGTSTGILGSNGNVGIGTTAPGNAFNLVSTATTATVAALTANSLTTGTLMNLSSTSTSLSTGGLMALDWSPSGATTIYATGDLLSLNIGQYGSIGNIFNVKDNGSSVFSVSQTAVTTSLPASFTSPGDVSLAYDLNFTNPTASFIKSAAPLYITAGESFNSSDLTLQTYNAGSTIITQDNQPTAAGTSYAMQILPNLTSSTNSLTYTAQYGEYLVPTVNLTGTSGTVTSLYNNYQGLTATAGTVTNWYGYYVASPTGGGTVTNKYAFISEAGAGNVGIGTTAPGQALDVVGAGYFSTGAYIGANSTNNLISTTSTGASSTQLYIGNLPIVTTTGTGGSITGSTNQVGYFTGTNTLGGSNNLWFNGTNVGIGTTGPAYLLDVNGTGNFVGNLRISNAQPTFYLMETDQTNKNWNFAAAGGNLYIQTVESDLTNTRTKLMIQSDGGISAGSYAGTTAPANGMIISGNVGIGTTAPGAKLEVYANTNSAIVELLRLRQDGAGAGAGSKLSFQRSDGEHGYIQNSYIDAALTYNTAISGKSVSLQTDRVDKVTITNAGNVGIGTTNPLQKLEVNGAGYFSSGAYIGANSTNNLISTTSTGAGSTQLYIGNLPIVTTTGGGGSITGSTNQVGYFTGTNTLGGSNNLWFNGTNVGIGTTSPGAKLEVNNIARITGGTNATNNYPLSGEGFEMGYASDLNSLNTGGSGTALFQSYSRTDSAWRGISFGAYDYNFKANDTSAMVINSSGNVGIGTTIPDRLLAVSGSFFAGGVQDGVSIVNRTIAGDLAPGGLGAGEYPLTFNAPGMNTTYLDFQIGGASKMFINNNGNVGIGTTSPGATLEVNGTLKVDSLTTGGSALYINGGVLSSSDISLKTNINDFGSILDKINALKPVTFDWKRSGTPDTGFIAQDVQQIFPELVSNIGDGTLGVFYTKFAPYLVKAIQEQQVMINDQIAKTSGLKIESDGTMKVQNLTANKLTISSEANLEGILETDQAKINSTALIKSYSSLGANTSLVEAIPGFIDIAASFNNLDLKVANTAAQLAETKSQVDVLSAAIASLSAQLQSSVISHQSSDSASQSSAISQSAGEAGLQPSDNQASSSASPSASLIADDSVLTTDLNLTPPSILLATTSAQLVNLEVTSDATISGKLSAYQASISDTFKALGETFLGNTTIAGDFSIDGTLSITGNSINSIGMPSDYGLPSTAEDGSQKTESGILYLQNSPLAQLVDIFNGLVTIDNTGKLVVQQIVAEKVTADKLELAPETLGEATIPTGQKEIPVFTGAVTQKSKVFLTATSSTGGQSVILGEIVPGSGFVVKLDHFYTADIKFNWLLIDQQ